MNSDFGDVPSTSHAHDTPTLPVDFVKTIASWSGIAIPVASSPRIAEATALHLQRIVDDARTFMINGRRTTLSPYDITRAIARRSIKPSFGFTSSLDQSYRRVELSGGRDCVFARNDQVTDVTSLISTHPPKLPVEVQIKAHWLSIGGGTPEIAENDVGGDEVNAEQQKVPRLLAAPYQRNPPRIYEVAAVRSLAVHDVPLEKHAFFKRITETCVCTDEGRREEMIQSLQSRVGLDRLVHPLCSWFAAGVQVNVASHNLAFLIYMTRMMRSLADNPHVDLLPEAHILVPAILSCMLADRVCQATDQDSHWMFREFAAKLLLAVCSGPGRTSTPGLQSKVSGTLDEEHVRVLNRCIALLMDMWRQPDKHTATHLYMTAFFISEMGDVHNHMSMSNSVEKLLVPFCARAALRVKSMLQSTDGQHTPGVAKSTEETAAERLLRLMAFRLGQFAYELETSDDATTTLAVAGVSKILTREQLVDKFGYFGDAAYKHLCNMRLQPPPVISSNRRGGRSKPTPRSTGNSASTDVESDVMAMLAERHRSRMGRGRALDNGTDVGAAFGENHAAAMQMNSSMNY